MTNIGSFNPNDRFKQVQLPPNKFGQAATQHQGAAAGQSNPFTKATGTSAVQGVQNPLFGDGMKGFDPSRSNLDAPRHDNKRLCVSA